MEAMSTNQHTALHTDALPPPPPELQAVIFDLGGTLIDYLGGAPSWPEMEYPGVLALHDCLTAAGFPVDAEAFRESFVHSMDHRWRSATEGLSDPPTLEALILEACHAAGFQLERELHEAAVAAYCAPIAARAVAAGGAEPLLAWLRGHGLRIGLISNTIWPAEVHRRDLARYGLEDHIDAMVFSSEAGFWKPDPRIFGVALDALGVAAEGAVFVGDRLLEDVQGAQRAGMRSVFVEGTMDYADIDVAAYLPDARVGHLADLPFALGGLWNQS
jgi:putative hydrolase of the HAD superfamily